MTLEWIVIIILLVGFSILGMWVIVTNNKIRSIEEDCRNIEKRVSRILDDTMDALENANKVCDDVYQYLKDCAEDDECDPFRGMDEAWEKKRLEQE